MTALRLLLAMALAPAAAAAALPPDSLMREVAVSATRRLADAGVQRTTLDSALLHRNVALAMSDILTRHTPLFIKSYGRATESTAEFRGTSPAHTQVRWNGLPLNSPMLGTVDFSTIPACFVDQAQLLHGASSVGAAAGALGGAVLLATKAPEGRGFGARYVQGIGSFATFDQFLRATYAAPRWSTSTRLAYATSRNDFKYTNRDKKVDVRDADGTLLASYHPTERNRSGYFHDLNALQEFYLTSPAAGRFGLQAWYSRSLRGLPFLSVDYRDDTRFTNEQRLDALRAVASWQHTLSGTWSLDCRAGLARQDIAYDYTASRAGTTADITHSRSLSRQACLQGEATFMPSARWLLAANAALRYVHVRSADRSPFHIGDNYHLGRAEADLALTARCRPLPRLALAAVVRQELYARDLVPLIPAAFAEYTILATPAGGPRHRARRQLVAKASVARNYRYPTMDDLYFRPGGNPDLRPERGITCDGGLEWALDLTLGAAAKPREPQPSLAVKANVVAFDSHITDWILWTPNVRGYWQPANLRRVHNYGTEAALSAALTLPAGWSAALAASYAFTPSINRSRDLGQADESYGKQLVYVPRHSANVSAEAAWRTWSIACQWQTYSERFTTTSNEVSYITGRLLPYCMSNLTLAKRCRLGRMEATVKAVVSNLFDSEYTTVLSRPMAGRNAEVFLELKFP